MGILDGYAFDPNDPAYRGVLGGLLSSGLLSPIAPSQGFNDPAQLPPTSTPTNGVTLPQPGSGGVSTAADTSNPFTALFSGLSNGVGGLFGGGNVPQQTAQPQQAPGAAAPAQPGLLDHLGAAWQGLGNGGLTSAVRGLISGQRADPQGLLMSALTSNYGVSPTMAEALVKNPQFMQAAAPTILAAPQQHATMQATYQALIGNGVPQQQAAALAQAAALNPKVLETIAPNLYSKPEFKTIKDQFGAEIPVFANADKQTITYPGANNGAPGTANAPQSPFLAPGVRQIDSNLVGDDYLKQFTPEVQQAVKAYVDGRSMPTGNPRQGWTMAIKQIAQKYGNDIGTPADDTTFNARSQMRKNLSTAAPNSLGGQINIGNTAIGHLEDLSQKAIALGNYNTPIAALGHAVNAIRGRGTDQAAKIQALQGAAQHYGQEITKFYAGSPGGEAERNRFISAVDGARTPQELAAVIETEAELMHSRLNALGDQIRGTLGERGMSEYPVLRPESAKSLDRIGANVAALRGGAPQAQQVAGPPAAAIQALKQQPNLAAQFDAKYGPGSSARVLGQ